MFAASNLANVPGGSTSCWRLQGTRGSGRPPRRAVRRVRNGRIKNVDFGAGHVAPLRLSFRDKERRVEATPQYEERRLVATKPFLPCRITDDVGPVVIEEVHLDTSDRSCWVQRAGHVRAVAS